MTATLNPVQQITIRKARPEDAAAISSLVLRTVRISNASDYPAQAIEQLIVNFASEKVAQRMAERDTFVADIAGRIVGTIALGGDRLRTLFVEPELQGSGLGARLGAHLEAHARAVGVSELKLSSSLTAHGFYERLGYRTVRLEEHDGVSTWLMVKTLA
ncbi:MAG: GNAT family N-acetyltransferase [Reyranella sp.]|nr:GNAT family N-acetyltransferase [Reyranella sp.]